MSLIRAFVFLIGSALYWYLICQASGVEEPWDADAYWRLWYPASFVLAAVAGSSFRARGWPAGAILSFAQLPVMWLNTETSTLWVVGVVIVSVLAIPVVAVSTLAGFLAARSPSR